MSFSATIDAGTLADALDPVHALVNECKIHLGEDGLDVRAVDPANVGMVALELDAGAFESYAADGGLIGINLDRLVDVVDLADSDDPVRLELDAETRKLTISADNLEFTLALIDPTSIRDEPDMPDLNLPATVVVEARALERGVTAADMVADHLRLAVNEDAGTFTVSADGDTDDVDLALGPDGLIDIEPAAASSLFSLEYLDDMSGAMPSGGAITAHLGEEMPVQMEFALADGDCQAEYMLAPRISNDGGP